LSFRQAFGERSFYLAAGYRRNCLSDACAVVDAIGRHRLASAEEDLDA
jgi:hypothetical protein